MLNLLPDSVDDFDNHTIYEVLLYSEAYLVECLKKKIPLLCLSFVDNLAIYDLLSFGLSHALSYPLIIEPTGLFVKFLLAS